MDREIVIKIPEEEYEEIINSEDCGLHILTRAIANGTPLPKGHGRLIDVIQLKAKMFDLPGRTNGSYWDGVDDVGDLIDNAQTVIDASRPEKGAEE